MLALPLAWTACSGGGSSSGGSAGVSSISGSTSQPLEVPSQLAATGLQGHSLQVPNGFGIRVWASVPQARFMSMAPSGDVLVSQPSQGRILLLRPNGSQEPQTFEFASGLRQPHDMVFRTISGTTWLYFTESNRVSRVVWQAGQTSMGTPSVIVDNLPDASSPGLGGTYGHELKNIAMGPDNKLYVSIASSCNACAEDANADPVRGAIYQYDADGSNGRLFARGIRNAEGLDFIPGSNTLWAVVNNRDEVRVPFDQDVDGDGNSDLGKIVPSYVDSNPPEPFIAVQDGGNYGWPFCNIVPNASMSNLSSAPDYELNPNGSVFNCAGVTASNRAFVAHSAPLGFSFLQASAVTPALRNGAVSALHGCWNCTSLRAGFKVVFIPFDGSGNPGQEVDLITGFVTNPDTREVWGRPVDAIADASGNLLVSDDLAGVIYQLYPK